MNYGRFNLEKGRYSVDSDGTFIKQRGTGDFSVTQYDCRNATNTIATFRIKIGNNEGRFRQVLAYATFDENYLKIVEEGLAEKNLGIYCSKNKLIRTLMFDAPVMQVISCRHHVRARDKIYFLLWNGAILRVTGSLLEDRNVDNDALDLELVNNVTNADNDDNADTDNCDGDKTDENSEYKGFCVYDNKVAVFGYDGLFIGDIEPRNRSANMKSIKILHDKIFAPDQFSFTRVILRLFSLHRTQ